MTVSEYKILQDFGNGLVKRSFDRTLLQAISSGGVGPWGVVVSYTFMMKPAPAGVSPLANYNNNYDYLNKLHVLQ